MNLFAKIFEQIFDSSIASDYVTRHVFMDLLVLADRDGVVDMTVDAISRRTNVPDAMVSHAIQQLMGADAESRSPIENGRRLVALDSHRDWGWQIVNYEHYRTIRDDESRRSYFRDYKREYRQAKKVTKSPHLSTSVLDCPTMSTKAEAETKVEAETDAGSELALASWLFEEANIPCDNSIVRVAADCIRKLAREGGTVKTAADFILGAVKRDSNNGETINRFWFTDQKYKPQKAKKNARHKAIEEWEPKI